MSETQFVVGKCKQCGEELRVPDHLEQFSCMYCGAKLTHGDLVEEVLPLDMEGNPAQLMEQVKSQLSHCVTGHAGMQKKISRGEYDATFAQYERACRPVFEELELACRLDAANRGAYLNEAVACFLDDLEAYWATKPGWKSRSRQSYIRDDDKMIIAIFLVPMIGHLKLDISQEFSETLQKKWMERYPKSPFFIGAYDDISGGFRKRFKLCFITTAVCQELGKPDDCQELMAFRSFRDGYLMDCPDGEALVREYYDIAPGIVTCIDHCGDRTDRYTQIRDLYLQPCFEALQQGRLADCKARYTQMVRDLQKQYLN